MDLFVWIWECLKENADYLAHARAVQRGSLQYQAEAIENVDMNNPAQFGDLNSHPNVFFLWILRHAWTGPEIDVLEAAMLL